MIRTYKYYGTLSPKDAVWCNINKIGLDIFHEPPREILGPNGRAHYYAGRTNIHFTTQTENTDLMLQIKFGKDLQLIHQIEET